MQQKDLKDLHIHSFGGDKTIRCTRQKQKLELLCLSPHMFDRLEDPVVCGYTTLKPPEKDKKRDDASGILKYGETPVSYVYQKKPKGRAVRGYFQVGPEQFVALTSRRGLLWLLLILLFIALAVLLSFCERNTPVDSPSDPSWSPTIDQNIGESPSAEAESKSSSIQIAGFQEWQIPAGEKESLPILLQNPKGNPCYFSFSIVLADSGETIYQSDMVPPGEAIRQVSLNRTFSPGVYSAFVRIKTNLLDSGREANDAVFQITIRAE